MKKLINDKRGISENAIGIFLIIVVFMIVIPFFVYVNIKISDVGYSVTEEPSINLKLVEEPVIIEQDGNFALSLKIKRDFGRGSLEGIDFLVNDGNNSESIKKGTNIGEFQEENFTILSSDLKDVKLNLFKSIVIYGFVEKVLG